MKLLLTQKNDVFDIVLEEGLNPKDFKFIEEALTMNVTGTCMKFKDNQYYFMFRYLGPNGYAVDYSPGEYSLEGISESHRGGWTQIASKVRSWLRNLKKETSTIDKWDNFIKELQVVPFAFDNNNPKEKFSKDELKWIDLKIETVKQGIKQLELPIESISQLNAKLDSLNDKADKLSRVNWKELFIGAIISEIFNLAIPSDSAKAIWEIVRHSFKQYILP